MSETAIVTSFETSAGAKIHRILLEAFPGFWAYAYVVQKKDYCVLIDCGSGTDSSYEDLVSGLGQLGLQPLDLTHIFLTHAHIDHFGGLSKIHPVTKAKIGVHELDLQTIAHHEARLALMGRRLASFLTDAGLIPERREQLLTVYRFTKTIYRSVPVDFTYEAMDMKVGPFEFIHLPGHCPGHVAIRLDDVVFCGDMVVEGVTPHLSPESLVPYTGLGHYLESLPPLQQWSRAARLVLNGHDEEVVDLAVQIESTRQNIRRRISKAISALGDSLTIEEVCRAVYGDTNGYNQLLVLEKMGAYIEYLYQHGVIEITNPDEVEQGSPHRYRRLHEIAESDLLPKERAYVLV